MHHGLTVLSSPIYAPTRQYFPPTDEPELLPDSQIGYYCFVSINVLGLEVVQKPSTLADEFQQTSSGVVIFLVNLEVLGKISDSFTQ